jgi:arylsulfatase A-like enzyme
MADEAVAWMKEVAPKGPFYMNYWMFSVHAPFDAKPELIERYRATSDPSDPQHSPTYAAMVHSMDDAVGRLLDAVDELGIAGRTAFVFTSDNGGNMYNAIAETGADGQPFDALPTSNAPLRGGKATMFEGGIRVPCVVAWPGITQPGSRSDAILQSTDFYPTLLGLLGIPLPENHPVDGIDIAPALRGEPVKRDGIVTYFPHSPGVPDWLPPSASVIADDWKLIRMFHQGENGAHGYRLYNVAEDIGEKNDLAPSNPERVQKLDAIIEKHLAESKAVVPVPNPNFDPSKYRPEEIGVQKGGPKKADADKGDAAPKKGKKAAGAARQAKEAGGQ